MRMTCPNCGVHGSIETFLVDAQARRMVQLVAELPPELSRIALPYIALFRPKQRGLQWKDACAHVEELMSIIKLGVFTESGITISVSPSLVADNINVMLNDNYGELRLPLKNHNYLRSMLARNAPKAEAKAEIALEKQKLNDSQAKHRQVETTEERMARMKAEHQQAEARRMLEEQRRQAQGAKK